MLNEDHEFCFLNTLFPLALRVLNWFGKVFLWNHHLQVVKSWQNSYTDSLFVKSALDLNSPWYPWYRRTPEWATRAHLQMPSFAAAAAKSLQLCPTLCDPRDSSPPRSPVPGILQARTLEWVAISFSNAWKRKVKVKSLSRVWLLATPWTAAYQAPPSMGFSRYACRLSKRKIKLRISTGLDSITFSSYLISLTFLKYQDF